MALLALVGGQIAAAAAEDPGDAAPKAVEPMQLGAPTLLLPHNQPAGARTGLAPDTEPSPDLGVQGIEVNTLGELDPESIGVLDSASGGFDRNMWRGSSRTAIERLLPRLPGVMTSASMRYLARRLLLTNATAPRRPGLLGGLAKSNLLAIRVDRLAALGDIEGLNDLLRVVPQRLDDEPIARARVEGLLLSGETVDACRRVRDQITKHHGAAYWRKALVFCQIVSGETDQAMLGVGLMREQGLSDDQAFFSLVDAYSGAEVQQLLVASPLHFVMLDAVGRPFPQELITEASPGLLVALAEWSGADLNQRIQAAERAVAIGVLKPQTLARLYGEMSFEPDQLENPIIAATEQEVPSARALLFQGARDEESPAIRAEILRNALDNASAEGLYHMAVRALLPLLTEVPPRPDLVWFAETAGRALYAAGRFEEAGAWFTLARQEAILNPQAAAAVAVLWPYSRLADRPALAWQGDLSAWREARGDVSADERDRQALLRGAFMALGESDSLSWIDLATETGSSSQPLPDAALLYALREASETRRLGETVLLALLVLGEPGPTQCHPMALNAALAALMQVGLEREARALAIEAAVAKGI